MTRPATRSDSLNHQGMASSATPEERFARRVRSLLEQSVATLPYVTLERLALGRKAALRAQRTPGLRTAPSLVLAGVGGGRGDGPRLGFARAGMAISAVLIVAGCIAGLYQVEQERRIQDLADVDSAVLNDDLPISAYADQGFNAFLKQNP